MTVYKPRAYQRRLTDHILNNAATAGFIKPGGGKTVSTLTAVDTLLDRGDIRAALVVAPLRVIQMVWPAEARKWNHTQHLTISTIHGLPNTRRRALAFAADIYLINYENLIWLADWMQANQKTIPFDMVIFDESSKMKSPSARRFKRIKPMLHRFSRSVLLTGTPSPNSYLDLWSQVYLLDRGSRLEPFITRYKDFYFYPADREGWTWAIKDGAAERIERRIADITCVLAPEDYPELPPCITNIVQITLPPKLMGQYKELEKELFVKLDTMDVEALNTATLGNKCLQFTSGTVYGAAQFTKDGEPLPRTTATVHTLKVDALEEIVDEAQGEPVMVAYWYQAEREAIRKRFPLARSLDSSLKTHEAIQLQEDWNAGKVPMLLIHPASAGHGLNLQAGGRILVWTTLPYYSAELYEQTVRRIWRPGQAHPVMVHHLTCPGTTDVAQELAIKGKDKMQGGLLAALLTYRKQV